MFYAHIPKLDSSASCFIQSRTLADQNEDSWYGGRRSTKTGSAMALSHAECSDVQRHGKYKSRGNRTLPPVRGDSYIAALYRHHCRPSGRRLRTAVELAQIAVNFRPALFCDVVAGESVGHHRR